MYHCVAVTLEASRGHQISGTGVMGSWEPPGVVAKPL